ncbi:MAG TPA: WG repeat-containing protein [Pyrinomonadaceae bacterium]
MRVRVRDERGKSQADETPVYTDSHALLIGNSAYSDGAWSDLPDVADDLVAVKEVLERQHGFKVEVALNRNRDALLRVIDQFISRYGQRYNNRLLIYYSGHGYTALLPDERRMGYLVMPDAPAMPPEEMALRTPPSEEEFEHFLPAAITMDEIETYARRITVRHALFVFDSCFSGTALYKDLGVGVPDQITTEELKPVRAYLTAGNETQRVPAFSRFRRKFVAGLMGDADTNGDGYITGSELGRWISVEVERDTGRRQTPVFGKSDLFKRGDLIFISPKGMPSPPPPRAQSPAPFRSSEQAFWQAIENSGEAGDFESYLAKSDSGQFTGIYRETATLKLNRLKAERIKNTWMKFSVIARSVLPYESTWVFEGGDDFAPIRQKVLGRVKCGYINRFGQVLIPPKYNECEEFSEGVARVGVVSQLRGKSKLSYGFINGEGEIVVPLKYEHADSFSEGLARVSLNGKYGFINKGGRPVVPLKFHTLLDEEGAPELPPSKFVDGLAPFSEGAEDTKYGFIDKTGKVVIEPTFDEAESFSDGLALVGLKEDTTGMSFAEKYRSIARGGNLRGFIDRSGKTVIPIKYESAGSFSEELAGVCLGGRCGFIDKAGHQVIPMKFEDISNFRKGLAGVQLNGKWGFIDRTGKQVIPTRYDVVGPPLDCGLIYVGLNDKFGFINREGKEVIPVKYAAIWFGSFIKDGFVGVTLSGRKGFADVYGNEYFDLQ